MRLGWARKHFALTAAGIGVLVVIADQWLKSQVRSGDLFVFNSWMEVAPHFNEGILGGLFSDLHPWIIRIFFSVLFGFIALIAALLLYFIRRKEIWRMKYGIVLYVAGILGNVLDRVIWGEITDYLILDLPVFRSYALNFADLALLSGVALMLVSLVRDHQRLWFDRNQRKSLIIEARFQFGFSFFLAFMATMNALIVAIYSFTFLKVYLDPGVSVPPVDALIRDYLIGLGVIEIGFLLITIGVGLIFSHRMAGPIYAFERYVERTVSGNGSEPLPFRLRAMDYFKSLEKTAELILSQVRSRK